MSNTTEGILYSRVLILSISSCRFEFLCNLLDCRPNSGMLLSKDLAYVGNNHTSYDCRIMSENFCNSFWSSILEDTVCLTCLREQLEFLWVRLV